MIPQETRERQIVPLAFQDRAVRAAMIDGVPWFVAIDVCDILGIKNPRDALKNFPEDERNTVDSTDGIHEGPGNPNVNIVNEPGLYRLIFQSRKPEAEQFKSWVFNSVLPQIRRTGFYVPDDSNANGQALTAAIARHFESRHPNKQADIDIGRCLVLLKETKRHGEFLPCIDSMCISRSTASRYMKLYRQSMSPELPQPPQPPIPETRQAAKRPAIWFNPLAAIRRLFHLRYALPMGAM